MEDALTAEEPHSTPAPRTSGDTAAARRIDWRVLFRASTAASSSPAQRVIPRLVAVSLSSETGYYAGLGDVVDYSALLSSSAELPSQQWDGRVVVSADADDIRSLQQRQRQQHQSLQAAKAPAESTSGGQCWTDVLALPALHPKNVYALPPLQNEHDAFEYFTQGQELIRQGHAVSPITCARTDAGCCGCTALTHRYVVVMGRWRRSWTVCGGSQRRAIACRACSSSPMRPTSAPLINAESEALHCPLCSLTVAAVCPQAWGGVADCIVSELRDEYDKTPVSAEIAARLYAHTVGRTALPHLQPFARARAAAAPQPALVSPGAVPGTERRWRCGAALRTQQSTVHGSRQPGSRPLPASLLPRLPAPCPSLRHRTTPG